MGTEISVEIADPEDIDGEVSHIDELDDKTTMNFVRLLDSEAAVTEVEELIASRLMWHRYIKYVVYYRITSGKTSD